MEELMARIENQLRITSPKEQNSKTITEDILLGKYHFSPGRYELKINDTVIKLSSRESEILSILCNHANKIAERRKLLHAVWGDDSFFNSRNLDVYIRKLRDYLSRDKDIEIITLKGKGYHFVVPSINNNI